MILLVSLLLLLPFLTILIISICLTSRKRFPYYNIEGDTERNTIVFKSGDESYTVEELVAQYIQKAREFAEDSTGKLFLTNTKKKKKTA